MGFCQEPFRQFHLLVERVCTCCAKWVQGIDWPLAGTNVEEIWNHGQLVRLRAALLEGSFEHCKHCTRIIGGELPDDPVSSDYQPIMATGPSMLLVGNDLSCNLSCWQCRRRAIYESPDYADQAARLRRCTTVFQSSLRQISISHSGDPFFSRLHREFLLELRGWPGLEIEICTNGVLFADWWAKLSHLQRYITQVIVSVDAATPATYEIVRGGSSWAMLGRSLEALAHIRSCGELERFQLNFCVRRANFREIPAFIELAKNYGADQVAFNLLRRRWHPQSQYDQESVALLTGSEREELLTIFQHPALSDPIVRAPMLTEAGLDLIRKTDHAV